MKGILTVLFLMLFVQACYTTTRNPESGAYYDGYHEQSAQEAETDQGDSEYAETEPLQTGNNYYQYDPYYMDRYSLRDYNRAWYWRSMYRPYYHRNDWRFSFYFGYNSYSPYYSLYDHHFYDPYYYQWQDYYYWNDFYNVYAGYPGSFYQPYSYYPNTYVYVQSGNPGSSNSYRSYGRLSQTSSGSAVTSPTPLPYLIPDIAIIPTTGSNSSVTHEAKKKKYAIPIESGYNKKRAGKVGIRPDPLPYLIPNIAIIPTKGSKGSGIVGAIKKKLGISIESGHNKKRSGSGKSESVRRTNKKSSKSTHTVKPSRSTKRVPKSRPPKSSRGTSSKKNTTKKDS